MQRLSKENSQITLVELPPTQFGVLNGDPGFDIYSGFRLPPRSLPTLEAVLRRSGWKNVRSINPLFHGTDGKLNSQNLNRILNSDALLVSSITRTSPQSQDLIRLYKQNNPNGKVIVGGPDPTFRPEPWMAVGADVVVRGEGEKTLIELTERLSSPDYEDLNGIRGIAYNTDGGLRVASSRELLTGDELGQLPQPYYDQKTRAGINIGVVETTRGCPHDCDFCSVTELYGGKYRMKPLEYAIEGIKLADSFGRNTFVVDDNFAASKSRTMKLLAAMESAGLERERMRLLQTTVKIGNDPELLDSLVNYFDAACLGIESISDETLKALNKPYTANDNKQWVQEIRRRGLWVHGMMMIGGDGDTLETLRETGEWINRNLDSAQLFTPTPLPGTRFFKQMEESGRILTKDWSLYDAQHVVVRPMNMSPVELQEGIYKMYKEFYSPFRNPSAWSRRLSTSPRRATQIGLSIYALSGGFDKVLANPQSRTHLEFLRSVS